MYCYYIFVPDKITGIQYRPGEEQLLQGSVAIPAAPPALRSNLSALREESLSPALQQKQTCKTIDYNR